MTRFLVARPIGTPTLDETYADEYVDADITLAYIVEDLALWPDGTWIEHWIVEAPDAGAASLIPPSKAESGPWRVLYNSAE